MSVVVCCKQQGVNAIQSVKQQRVSSTLQHLLEWRTNSLQANAGRQAVPTFQRLRQPAKSSFVFMENTTKPIPNANSKNTNPSVKLAHTRHPLQFSVTSKNPSHHPRSNRLLCCRRKLLQQRDVSNLNALNTLVPYSTATMKLSSRALLLALVPLAANAFQPTAWRANQVVCCLFCGRRMMTGRMMQRAYAMPLSIRRWRGLY